ncbi:hypothetical protein ACNOYE_01480 [Nannocystaceae bacterium ST9]
MTRSIRRPSNATRASVASASVGSGLWSLLILLVAIVLAPGWARAEGSPIPTLPERPAAPAEPEGDLEGGACGDEEEQTEELVHCGAEISVFDRPGLLGVLRESIERMTPGQCLELLDALYERETCQVGGRECGDLQQRGLPPAAPKSLSNGSGSAQSQLDRMYVSPAGSRVVGPRAASDRTPRARAIAPPDRPPRSLARG